MTEKKTVTTKPEATAKDVKETKELSLIEKMIKEINETTDKVSIDGRNYTTVAKRTEIVRKYLGTDVQITTKHLNIDNEKVIFKAKISVLKDGVWHNVATGHAEESRTSSELNKKAALENAETSAIGRALANFGLAGGEFASINELSVKTGLIAKADANVVEHVKSLVTQSGLKEKAILATYAVSSFDMLKEEDAFKIIKQCLSAIANKNAKNAKNIKPADGDEPEEIKL